jgi:hypothetical protein
MPLIFQNSTEVKRCFKKPCILTATISLIVYEWSSQCCNVSWKPFICIPFIYNLSPKWWRRKTTAEHTPGQYFLGPKHQQLYIINHFYRSLQVAGVMCMRHNECAILSKYQCCTNPIALNFTNVVQSFWTATPTSVIQNGIQCCAE